MTDKVEDQFSILLNSLNSSLLQKELPKDAIDESLHVWQPVPFASKEIEISKTILKELPSIGTQTFTDVSTQIVQEAPTVVSLPISSLPAPPITAPTTPTAPTAPIAPTLPVTVATVPVPSTPPVSIIPSTIISPLPQLLPPPPPPPIHVVPDYMYPNPYMYGGYAHSSHLAPPSLAPSYPISYAPPSYAPSYVPNMEDVQQTIEIKDKENKFYLWALYIFGFSIILFIVFGLLWYFYIKDYNKYKLTNNDEKNDEFDDKSTLLQPPSTLHNELKHIEPVKEFNAFEFEKLIKDEEKDEKEDIDSFDQVDQEDDEYFQENKVFESLNALETLNTIEKKEFVSLDTSKAPEKKLEKPKKNYFDLSDMDSSDFVSPPQLEKKMSAGGKLTDESPEVNDYAKKRELALQ